MIKSRLTFGYEGKTLLEKVVVKLPFKYDAIFQNRGCFIYFKEVGPKLLSSEKNRKLQGNEAVLLKCGSHFIDLLKNSKKDTVEVLIIHLFPEY